MFNRIHESKVRRLENERGERDRILEREREDHKHELQVRDKLISLISDWFAKDIVIIMKVNFVPMKEAELVNIVLEQLTVSAAEFIQLLGLVNLYHKDMTITAELSKFSQINSEFLQAVIPGEPEERKASYVFIFKQLNLPAEGAEFNRVIANSLIDINNLITKVGERFGTFLDVLKTSEHTKPNNDKSIS